MWLVWSQIFRIQAQSLPAHQAGVSAVSPHKLAMVTHLHDLALLHHHNLIGFLHGGQPDPPHSTFLNSSYPAPSKYTGSPYECGMRTLATLAFLNPAVTLPSPWLQSSSTLDRSPHREVRWRKPWHVRFQQAGYHEATTTLPASSMLQPSTS